MRRSSSALPQRLEADTHLIHQELRLLPRRKVPALAELAPVGLVWGREELAVCAGAHRGPPGGEQQSAGFAHTPLAGDTTLRGTVRRRYAAATAQVAQPWTP